MKLGFCPMVLQHRTDGLSRGLLDVHKMIQNWDDRLEELIPVPSLKVFITCNKLINNTFFLVQIF